MTSAAYICELIKLPNFAVTNKVSLIYIVDSLCHCLFPVISSFGLHAGHEMVLNHYVPISTQVDTPA